MAAARGKAGTGTGTGRAAPGGASKGASGARGRAAGTGGKAGAGARRRGRAPAPWRAVALTAGLVLLADQALKYVVVHLLALDQRREIDLLDPWLNLRMAWNQGVNFGLFSSEVDVMRWVLVAVALAVCLWVGIWVGRARPGRLARISAGMLIGGALGNVIDRLAYGAVADFLNMSLPGWSNPYSFNLADIAIFLGALGLVVQPPARGPAPRARPRSRAATGAPRPRRAAAAPAGPDAAGPDAADPGAAGPGAAAIPPSGDKPRDEHADSR